MSNQPMTDPRESDDHMAQAVALTAKIEQKVTDLLAPLEREMQIMKWAPEFRAILWEAVAMRALQKMNGTGNG